MVQPLRDAKNLTSKGNVLALRCHPSIHDAYWLPTYVRSCYSTRDKRAAVCPSTLSTTPDYFC